MLQGCWSIWSRSNHRFVTPSRMSVCLVKLGRFQSFRVAWWPQGARCLPRGASGADGQSPAPSVQAEQIPSSITGLRVWCLPGMGTACCSIKSSINFHFISRFLLSFLSVKNGPASGLLEPVAWLEQAPGFNFSQLSVTFCDENQIA